MNIAYYALETNKNTGKTVVTLVTKDFWDRNHVVDDGNGDSYDALSGAMRAIGAKEISDCAFELNAPDNIGDIITKMSREGFALRVNDEFSTFIERTAR